MSFILQTMISPSSLIPPQAEIQQNSGRRLPTQDLASRIWFTWAELRYYMIKHNGSKKNFFQQPRWWWLGENSATFQNASSPPTVSAGGEQHELSPLLHAWICCHGLRCLQVRATTHLGFWACIFLFLPWNAIWVALEFLFLYLFFFPRAISLVLLLLLFVWFSYIFSVHFSALGVSGSTTEHLWPGCCLPRNSGIKLVNYSSWNQAHLQSSLK